MEFERTITIHREYAQVMMHGNGIWPKDHLDHFATRFPPRLGVLGCQIFGWFDDSSPSGAKALPLLINGAPRISLTLSRSCAARSNSRFFAASSISSSSSLMISV